MFEGFVFFWTKLPQIKETVCEPTKPVRMNNVDRSYLPGEHGVHKCPQATTLKVNRTAYILEDADVGSDMLLLFERFDLASEVGGFSFCGYTGVNGVVLDSG